MPQYMFLIYAPVGLVPTPEQRAEAAPKWQAVTQDLGENLKFASGLAGVDVATTVRVRDGETQVTDGPFAETKDYLAGAWLLEAPDLDAALDAAGRVPAAGYGAVEVRPLWGRVSSGDPADSHR
jgi:hypothetical protein